MIESEDLSHNPFYLKFDENKSFIIEKLRQQQEIQEQNYDSIDSFGGENKRKNVAVFGAGTAGVRNVVHEKPIMNDGNNNSNMNIYRNRIDTLEQNRAYFAASHFDSEDADKNLNSNDRTMTTLSSMEEGVEVTTESRTKYKSILFCVPQALSLRNVSRLTMDDIESHVLYPKTSGFFHTLNGKEVLFKGNRLFVGKKYENGMNLPCSERNQEWKEERVVRIIYTEDIPFNNIIIKVLHIERPLQGGCMCSCTMEGMDMELIHRYYCLLSSFPENEYILYKLKEFIDIVQSKHAYIGPKRENTCDHTYGVGYLQKLVRHWIKSTYEAIIQSSELFKGLKFLQDDNHKNCFSCCCSSYKNHMHRGLHSQVKRHSLQVKQVIEGHVMEKLHDVIMHRLREEWSVQDRKLEKRVNELCRGFLTQQDLGMRPEFQCSQDLAIKYLSTLNNCLTPLEKLLCLERVVTEINTAVENNIKVHFEDISAFLLTADDLLDQLIYVIVYASEHGLKDLVAQIHFIRDYHTINVNTTLLGYNLANVQVAVNWLLSDESSQKDTLAQILIRKMQNNNNKNKTMMMMMKTTNSFIVGVDDLNENKTYLAFEINQSEQDILQILDGTCGENEMFIDQSRHDNRGVGRNNNHSRPQNEEMIFMSCSRFTPHLFCWINPNGRVCVSTGMHHSILSRQRFLKVACGENHMLALTELGTVFAWGENIDGQCGIGNVKTERCTSPVEVTFPSGDATVSLVSQIACGSRHSLCCTDDGKVFSWGRGNCGRLGHGDTKLRPSPEVIKSLLDVIIRTVDAGWSHSIAISNTGNVFTWGCGAEGRLGLGSFADAWFPKPIHPCLFQSDPAAQVSAGYAHTCILTKSGQVYCCGSGYFGQLGFGERMLPETLLDNPPPTQESNTTNTNSSNKVPPSIEKVEELQSPSIGIVYLDRVETPRRKSFKRRTSLTGPLFLKGHGEGTVCLVPQPVSQLENIKITSIDCGKFHTACVSEDGCVYVWGYDESNHNIIPRPLQLENTLAGAADLVVCGAKDTYILYGEEFFTSFKKE